LVCSWAGLLVGLVIGLRCWAARPGKPVEFPSIFLFQISVFFFCFSILIFWFVFKSDFCLFLQVLNYLNINLNW
jgi:hypothetical protein